MAIPISQNLFDDLLDDPADWEVALQHELATQPVTALRRRSELSAAS